MGRSYRHFLVPANGELVPSPGRVSGLVQRLMDYRFLPSSPPRVESGELESLPDVSDESLYVRLVSADYRLSWELSWPEQATLRCPFVPAPSGPARLTVSLYGSTAYLAPLSELVDPLGEPPGAEAPAPESFYSRLKGVLLGRERPLLDLDIRCSCGGTLEDSSELFHDYTVLRTRCSSCGLPFRPAHRKGKLRSGWSNGLQRRDGGLLHRFGVLLDCGVWLPAPNGPGQLDPKFGKLVSDAIGASLFEFPDLY